MTDHLQDLIDECARVAEKLRRNSWRKYKEDREACDGLVAVRRDLLNSLFTKYSMTKHGLLEKYLGINSVVRNELSKWRNNKEDPAETIKLPVEFVQKLINSRSAPVKFNEIVRPGVFVAERPKSIDLENLEILNEEGTMAFLGEVYAGSKIVIVSTFRSFPAEKEVEAKLLALKIKDHKETLVFRRIQSGVKCKVMLLSIGILQLGTGPSIVRFELERLSPFEADIG